MATLTDAGPLVALIDKSEAKHGACVAALAHVSMPLVTTWPCVTEAMYLLGRNAGWTGQELLWNLIEKDQLEIHSTNSAETRRMRALMEKYQDATMDLADASLFHYCRIARTAGRLRSRWPFPRLPHKRQRQFRGNALTGRTAQHAPLAAIGLHKGTSGNS